MELNAASITVAGILPFILAIINQPKFSSSMKQIISIIAVVIVGVGLPMLQGNFDWTNILANTGIVFATMQSVYAGLNKTGIWDAINTATTPKSVASLPETPEDYNPGDTKTLKERKNVTISAKTTKKKTTKKGK